MMGVVQCLPSSDAANRVREGSIPAEQFAVDGFVSSHMIPYRRSARSLLLSRSLVRRSSKKPVPATLAKVIGRDDLIAVELAHVRAPSDELESTICQPFPAA